MTTLEDFEPEVRRLAVACLARHWHVATAESCTGGLIAAACTAMAGSSAWFERGFVTYSNESKHELLDVDEKLLARHGAVSQAVACAMAEGAIARAHCDLAVAVTGIAGPGGAVPGKPVGTVWLALARRGRPAQALLLQLQGDRAAVRAQTVRCALQQLIALAEAGVDPAAA